MTGFVVDYIIKCLDLIICEISQNTGQHHVVALCKLLALMHMASIKEFVLEYSGSVCKEKKVPSSY